MHVEIEKRELIEAESELYCPGLARFDRDPPEAAQFLDGAGDRTYFIADIELYYFITANFAGVAHVYADLGLSRSPNGCGVEMEIAVFECRVAQAPSEWEQRLRGGAEVSALGGRLLIVVVGELADRAWHGDGQFAAGVSVAKQNICNCRATFLPEVPSVENRGNVF